jgi:hypothetical protein
MTHGANNQEPAVFLIGRAIEIRSQGTSVLRSLLDQTAALGAALVTLDASLQVFAEDRGVDEMQAVIAASRNLSTLVDESAVAR